MIIKNDNNLIGDFIGTIPAMQALGADVVINDNMQELLNMAGLKRSFGDYDLAFDLHAAFALADRQNLHMIQANFAYAGLAIPQDIPKPKLNWHSTPRAISFDYVLAPFSRSLPEVQLWQREKWQALVNRMPDKTFCLLGHSTYDAVDYITGPNVYPFFNQTMNELCQLLRASRNGLISVVTGISHLAHALSVKNYLFVNQGTWGKNPDAIYFDKHIPDILVDDVICRLKLL